MSPSFHSSLLAGAIAGITVDISLFPLDTLKTRLQSSSGFFPSGGFSGIYRGIGSALVGSAPGAAVFFCTYDSVKHALLDITSTHHTSTTGTTPSITSGAKIATHMLASSLGEIAACAVRVPTEVIKQRAQAGLHRSSAQALAAILAKRSTHGLPTVWRELYRGWTITVFREVPFTVIQFPLWEAFKAWSLARKDNLHHDNGRHHAVSAPESALYGSAAGAVAAAITTPLDVLKTRVMLSGRKLSVPSLFRSILRDEGIRPLFAGIAPRVMWISIGGAIFLGSYQWAINAMNDHQHTGRDGIDI